MEEISRERKMSSDWPILTKLRCKLLRGCYTQATCLVTLRKVEGRSTFFATRNATIAAAKWGVTREFFLANCNETFVSLQVAKKKLLRVTWPLGRIHTNRFSNENRAVLLPIWLSSTLQRRKRSPRTESFENALQSRAI